MPSGAAGTGTRLQDAVLALQLGQQPLDVGRCLSRSRQRYERVRAPPSRPGNALARRPRARNPAHAPARTRQPSRARCPGAHAPPVACGRRLRRRCRQRRTLTRASPVSRAAMVAALARSTLFRRAQNQRARRCTRGRGTGAGGGAAVGQPLPPLTRTAACASARQAPPLNPLAFCKQFPAREAFKNARSLSARRAARVRAPRARAAAMNDPYYVVREYIQESVRARKRAPGCWRGADTRPHAAEQAAGGARAMRAPGGRQRRPRDAGARAGARSAARSLPLPRSRVATRPITGGGVRQRAFAGAPRWLRSPAAPRGFVRSHARLRAAGGG